MTTLEPRIWKHTILQGDDDDRLRDLRAAAAALEPKGERGESDAELMSDDDPWAAYDAACAEADAFAAEAAGRGVTVILRAIGHKRWKDLVKQFPPGEDEADKAVGVEVEPFTEALILAAFSSPLLDDTQAFLDDLTPADYDTISGGAWALHKRLGADPKALMRSVRDRS